MTVTLVVDRIEGAVAVCVAEGVRGSYKIDLPLSSLPEGVAEGDCLAAEFSDGGDTAEADRFVSAKIDEAEREKRAAAAKSRLRRLFGRRGGTK
jgi:hypothetical protein